MDFSGIWTALITPFDKEGYIDWSAFEHLVNDQLESDITGLTILGTTAESPTLNIQEKLSLVRKSRALLRSSKKIMVGVGSSDTNQVVEFSKLVESCGADCLLVVTPPYNKPSIDGLFKHYNKISENVDIPICLYHVPSRTGQTLDINMFKKLSEIESIKAIKEASDDIDLIFKISHNISSWTVLSGEDGMFLPSLTLGAKGIISVASNIFFKEISDVYKFFIENDIEKSKKYFDILKPFIDLLFCETNPMPLKAAMSMLSKCENKFRLPLSKLSDQNFNILNKKLFQTLDILKNLDEK